MLFEFFIAKKHIFEHKKQSFIGIIGIAIGIIVLTVSIGISNGLNKNMIDSILSLSSHVTVIGNENLKDYEKLENILSTYPEVKGVIPKVSSQGIVKYNGILGTYISGVKLDGLDLEKAIPALNLQSKIKRGSIDFKNMKGVLIGEELLNRIGGNIGDPINIISANNKELQLEIMGTFQSGYYDYDLSMIILPLKTAQYITERDNTLSSMDLILKNPYDADKVSNKVYNDTGLYNRTWGSLNQNLLKALTLEKTVMIIGFSLIVIIAGFVVWVILNTMVREKIRYIGIMRSVGISHGSIIKIFLIQGVILGLTGIIIGVFISLFLLWYIKTYSLPGISSIYYLTKVPIELSLKELLTIVGANTLLIFLSSVFPAYRAGKLKIVEALRHD
ncbi:ABC transporter permease [Cetobacterium somerae]|uniref:ABC transporter permease n=1 Tax=Cetobacterium sp. NK01 TaxID=2993530 RepID=UPI00211728DC|nr:ABC transporter permease [Cetobacterium sp. NK01]MCQ8212608.1 ABC transporter permease [Cetobacterium sp. NK01]